MTRIGVVGCGITGLALVHYLAERDADAVAFEASGDPGGVIRTTRHGGRVLEHGPQRMRLTDPVADLVDALDLRDELLVADDSLPLYVYYDGKLRRVPTSIRALLTTDLLSLRGKLRLLGEPLTAPGRGDETAAELFARKFGVEAYENFIGPLFGGVYGSDPDEMPARHALAGLLRFEEREGGLLLPGLERVLSSERPPAVSFADGMQRFPGAIADRHRDRLEFDTPVASIREEADGYRIVSDDGGSVVDEVVLTTPADAAADLVGEVAPDAPGHLRSLTYNPLAVVHLHAEPAAEGFGYQVRADEGFHTLGVSWNASMFDRDGVYTCFLGGMRNPDVVERDAEGIGAIAAEEFAAVMGAEAEVLNVSRLDRGFPAYDESWDALDRVDLPDGVHLATNYTARMGVPSRVREARDLAESLVP